MTDDEIAAFKAARDLLAKLLDDEASLTYEIDERDDATLATFSTMLDTIEKREAKLKLVLNDRLDPKMAYRSTYPAERGQIDGAIENCLQGIIKSAWKDGKAGKPCEDNTAGARMLIEGDIDARGWAILPHLAGSFDDDERTLISQCISIGRTAGEYRNDDERMFKLDEIERKLEMAAP